MESTTTLTGGRGRRLSIAEAASHAGIAPRTLRNRIEVGQGPAVERIGRRVVVALADLESWIASQPAPLTRESRQEGAGAGIARLHAGAAE